LACRHRKTIVSRSRGVPAADRRGAVEMTEISGSLHRHRTDVPSTRTALARCRDFRPPMATATPLDRRDPDRAATGRRGPADHVGGGLPQGRWRCRPTARSRDARIAVRFGLGFGLPSPILALEPPTPNTLLVRRRGSFVLIDTDARMTFAYAMNRMQRGLVVTSARSGSSARCARALE